MMSRQKLQATTRAGEQRRKLCRDEIFYVETKQPIGPECKTRENFNLNKKRQNGHFGKNPKNF